MNYFDIEQLRSFITAVETGSLTAAAPLRYLSQSAISEQIRKLEQSADQTLLIRSKRGVSPTLAGKKLLSHARGIVALSEAAWHDLQHIPLQAEIHLGITDYCRPEQLATILAHLSITHPQIKLRTTVGKSANIEHAWKNEEIDIAIVMRLSHESSLALKPYETLLYREDMLWAGSQRSTDKPLPLVLLPEDCSIHQMAIKTLTQYHVPYFIQHIASGVKGIQSALDAGLGVTCINDSSLPRGFNSVGNFSTLPKLPVAEFILLNHHEKGGYLGEKRLDFSGAIKDIFSAR